VFTRLGVAMRASCEGLRQRISLSVKAISKQRNFSAKVISAVIALATIGIALQEGVQREPEMPEVAAQAVASKDAHGFVPSLGSGSMANSSAEAPAEAMRSNDAALRTVLDMVAPTAAPADAGSDAMANEPKYPAAINQEIAPPIASNLFGTPAAGISNSKAAANPAVEHQTIPTPVSAGERAREIAAIRRAKLVEDRQEWRYCLASSYAERKVYLSTPIPSSAISESAEAAFDRTLKKDNIAHDEVQCPRAPNRPTLLFRQRYAVRWNQENGNTVVTFKWQALERGDTDLTGSQPLVASSTALPIR
jgi:hypothetical protein